MTMSAERVADAARHTVDQAVGAVRHAQDWAANEGGPAAVSMAASAVDEARTGIEHVSARLPGLAEAGAAQSAVTFRSLQGLPDDRLLLLATFSVGLGVGLWLAGAGRLVTIAALSPALVMGLAAASRNPGARSRGRGRSHS